MSHEGTCSWRDSFESLIRWHYIQHTVKAFRQWQEPQRGLSGSEVCQRVNMDDCSPVANSISLLYKEWKGKNISSALKDALDCINTKWPTQHTPTNTHPYPPHTQAHTHPYQPHTPLPTTHTNSHTPLLLPMCSPAHHQRCQGHINITGHTSWLPFLKVLVWCPLSLSLCVFRCVSSYWQWI